MTSSSSTSTSACCTTGVRNGQHVASHFQPGDEHLDGRLHTRCAAPTVSTMLLVLRCQPDRAQRGQPASVVQRGRVRSHTRMRRTTFATTAKFNAFTPGISNGAFEFVALRRDGDGADLGRPGGVRDDAGAGRDDRRAGQQERRARKPGCFQRSSDPPTRRRPAVRLLKRAAGRRFHGRCQIEGMGPLGFEPRTKGFAWPRRFRRARTISSPAAATAVGVRDALACHQGH